MKKSSILMILVASFLVGVAFETRGGDLALNGPSQSDCSQNKSVDRFSNSNGNLKSSAIQKNTTIKLPTRTRSGSGKGEQ